MLTLKTKPMMSTEILSFDSALLSPADQSFTNGCPQTQHCSEIKALLASDQWLQDFDDIRHFCEGLDLDLEYEPELSLEAMTKEVETQYQSKEDDIIDYLDSSAFLSPVSIEPSSPQYDGHSGQDTGIDSETAISLLEEILVANSDNSLAESELTLAFASDEAEVPAVADTVVVTEGRPKRQTKRKAPEVETIEKPKAKKSKSNESKRERKRSQNKYAANRYRQKKRAELDGMEKEYNEYAEANATLKAQLQKLQMEFKVVYPLAKAAFASDPNRSLQLQMLDIRVLNGELLE